MAEAVQLHFKILKCSFTSWHCQTQAWKKTLMVFFMTQCRQTETIITSSTL